MLLPKSKLPTLRAPGVSHEDWRQAVQLLASDSPDATTDKKAAMLERLAAAVNQPAWKYAGGSAARAYTAGACPVFSIPVH